MPGFNHQIDEVTSPSSEFSFGLVPSSDMYSLAQTGPSDHLGSSWVGAGDGQQHMNDFPGHSQTVDAEDYSLAAYGAPTPPHGTELDLSEEFRKQCASPRSESAKRLQSRSPGISSKRRNTKSGVVSKSQARLAPAPTSSSSSRVSNMGLTGNTIAFQNATNGHFLGMNQPLYQEPEPADTLSNQMYYQDMSLELDMNSGMAFPDLHPMHVDPTHMQFDPDTNLTATSTPGSWNATFTPPQSPPNAEDTWYQPSLGSSESAGSSPSDYGMGQGYPLGQDLAIQGLGNGDMSAIGHEDSFAVSAGPSRRPRSEGETARDHHLYKNAAPQADGLFHCPWEGTAECHHKAEKLKCNYDKFVDSHLRPYRCKVESCADARFSSTACLLRHEREAHRMHGHQAYNCTYKGCERSLDGKGFPRAWNLKDHMRRVHNDHGNGPVAGSQRGAAAEEQTKARRKSKTSTSGSSSRKSSKSMPVVDTAAEESMDRMQQDFMDWEDYYKNLQGAVQQLGKPTDSESRRQLKKAQKYLDQMSSVYERIHTNPNGSHRHSHGD